MRKIILVILLIFNFHQILAQQDKKIGIDTILYQITDVPYIPELSGDSLFWVIVMQGLDVVPSLIEELDDTTITSITIPNFGGFYTIADISFSILGKIIHKLPILDIIRTNKEYPLDEGLTYWSFVKYNYKNRIYLKQELNEWFIRNKEKLIWIPDFREYKAVPNWKFPTKQYPSKGYYKLANDE